MVLTGAGGAFCSGADLSDPNGPATDPSRSGLARMRRLGDVALALHHVTKPTIAKVDGFAVGAGLSLALGCDLIVCSDRAKLSMIFARRGLALDNGASWLLPRSKASTISARAAGSEGRSSGRIAMSENYTKTLGIASKTGRFSADARRPLRHLRDHSRPLRETFDQHRQLSPRHAHRPLANRRPGEVAVLKPFGRQNQTRAIEHEQLQTIRSLRAKDENVAAVGLAGQTLRHERDQTMHAFSEVDRLRRHKHPDIPAQGDHRVDLTAALPDGPSTPPSAASSRPAAPRGAHRRRDRGSPPRSHKRPQCGEGRDLWQSTLIKAIDYMLERWEGLTAFLDDGRLEPDTNPVERSIRPIAIGKKNSLFSGDEGGGETWAILSSLLNTARLNGVDPEVYLVDVLERMVSGATKNNQLHELLVWNWKAAREAERRAAA